MKIQGLIALSQKFVTDNAPTILTGSSVVGVVGTAVLAGKASWQGSGKIQDLNLSQTFDDDGRMISVPSIKDKAMTLAPLYIPPVVAGGLTISAILFNHKINAQRLAAMAAVYALSDGKYKDYKAKVEELMGLEKKQEVEAAIADDKAVEVSKKTPGMFMIGQDEALIFDLYSGRYFKSTVPQIEAAVNKVNAKAISHNYVALHDFWDEIGLDQNAMSDIVGFTVESMLEVNFVPHINENDMPYLMMEYSPVSLGRWNHHG